MKQNKLEYSVILFVFCTIPIFAIAQKYDIALNAGSVYSSIYARPVEKNGNEKTKFSYYSSLEIKKEIKNNWKIGFGIDFQQIRTKTHQPYTPYEVSTNTYFSRLLVPCYFNISKKILVGVGLDYFLIGIESGALFSFTKSGTTFGKYADANSTWLFAKEIRYPMGIGYMAGIDFSYVVWASNRLGVKISFQPRYLEYYCKFDEKSTYNRPPRNLEGWKKISAISYPLSLGLTYTIFDKVKTK